MWLPQNTPNISQMDLGFVRKTGTGTSGYGRIAEVTFYLDYIIIIDIGDRTEDRLVPMTIPINGIIGIDEEGEPVQLNVPQALDTIWLKIDATTPVMDPTGGDEQGIDVFPNPATDGCTISSDIHPMEDVEVYNALGQLVYQRNTSGLQQLSVPTQDWAKGIYTVRIRSGNAIFEHPLMKQ
jgi:hypothetical protein